MKVEIDHRTTYLFDRPLTGALQQVRLTPDGGASQRVSEWKMDLDGAQLEVSFRDHHANAVHLISLQPGAAAATIRCSGVVETVDTSGVDAKAQSFAPIWLYRRSTELTTPGDEIASLLVNFGESSDHSERSAVGAMHALSQHIGDTVAYDMGWTDATSTAEQALAAGHGVCQDHAHIFVTAVRELGYPARYVSGYLLMDDRADQDATHAWAEVWIDDLGWVGFDISNGISPDERYVRVAVGLDYREAAPISGLRFGAGNEQLEVSLQVQQQ